MTKRKPPSTEEQSQPDLAADALVPADLHIQQHLPAIARILVALALQGNVSAASLCFRVGNPRLSVAALLERGFRHLTPDDLDELALILADTGYLTADGLLLPTPSPSCGTIDPER